MLFSRHALEGVTHNNEKTQYYACCPAHNDTKASLSLAEGADGKLLMTCHAGCTYGAIMEALGNTTPEFTAHTLPLDVVCSADVEEREVEWLWQDVLVKGALNSIQGIAGIGKTFLLCALTAAVSRGGLVQGVGGEMETVPRGKVLYLSGDDDPATTIKPRLSTFHADHNNVFFLPLDKMPPIGSPEFASMFEQVRPSLAVVDTLQHFLPPKTEINSANGTTCALQPLKVLAERFGCAVVVIQHINKMAASGNGGESVNFGIGSSAVNGLFRSVWTLGRIKDDDGKPTVTRALCPSKANLVKGDPPAVLFDLSAEYGFQWAGTDSELRATMLYAPPTNRPKHRPNDKREEVKACIQKRLQDGKMLSAHLQGEVVIKTGCSKSTFERAGEELGVKRLQSGRQWYSSLPDDTG